MSDKQPGHFRKDKGSSVPLQLRTIDFLVMKAEILHFEQR